MKSLITVISGTFSRANSYLNENMKALVSITAQLTNRVLSSYRMRIMFLYP